MERWIAYASRSIPDEALCSSSSPSRLDSLPAAAAGTSRRSVPRTGRTCCSSRSIRCAPTTSGATDTRARPRQRSMPLAERGVRFETAVAHAPLTGPSHASILTGQTPLGHGFRNNSGFTLSPQVRTAAEDFRQAGYRTAGVRLRVSAGSPVWFRSRIRHLRRSPAQRQRPPPDAVRRAVRGCDDRRGCFAG